MSSARISHPLPPDCQVRRQGRGPGSPRRAMWQTGSGFFYKVYRLVCLIPPGKVATYGQIAALLGHPRAARTVGWALHSLSDEQARVVPWQRVIGAGGRITTSCETHSAQLQRQLLEEEGIQFGQGGDIDLARFQWRGPEWNELDALLHLDPG